MNKTIVLVDDDQGIREVITIILSESGYEVVTIEQDKAVEETILKVHPQVILLDIWISGKDGRDILKRLKKNPHTQHIPVLMISAKNDGAVLAEQAGADGFITKPFDIDEFLQKIDKFSVPSLN